MLKFSLLFCCQVLVNKIWRIFVFFFLYNLNWRYFRGGLGLKFWPTMIFRIATFLRLKFLFWAEKMLWLEIWRARWFKGCFRKSGWWLLPRDRVLAQSRPREFRRHKRGTGDSAEPSSQSQLKKFIKDFKWMDHVGDWSGSSVDRRGVWEPNF